jgi:tetratricopeptide (TPR) repeat protein
MTYSSRLSAFCDKVIEASWLAAVILAPLFFNVYSSRVFEPDKITLVRSLALIMVGAWIIKWLEERRAPRSGADRVTWRTPLMLPTLLFIGFYLIASLLSVVPRVALMGSYQRLQGFYSMLSYIVIFWMILMNMRRREQLERIVTVIVITSLPIAFYGLIQHANKDPLPWGGDVTQRVAGNMGNAIFIAAYLIMAFFLTLGRLVQSFQVILTEKESRVSDILRASVYLFIAALQLIAFAFADSRGPLLGWLPGMFIFALVGLLLLRVSLHTQADDTAIPADGTGKSTTVRYPITVIDVFKAIALAGVCGISAYAGYLLVPVLFPDPKITMRIVVALLGGLLPLLAAVGIRRTAARWAWASWIFFSLLLAVGLFVINLSTLPQIEALRQSGSFGKLATLFESEGGTGKVRSLIWEGAAKLVLPHDPLQFPDGSQDNLNFVRPLIGYGPESMYVAYNRFYPPDLAHYEARNASPDRSHNETWDSLVNTGVIGFVLEQFLFLSTFFFALKFIGWIPNRRAALLLIGLLIGGGILGTIALYLFKGLNFIGTGWPGGVTAGIVIYVVAFALFHFQVSRQVYAVTAAILIALLDVAAFSVVHSSSQMVLALVGATIVGVLAFGVLYAIGRYAFGPTAGQSIQMSGHIFMIVALFGAILAHYLEISLAGIAIASTRTYFWTYAGLLVVLGLHWVPAEDEDTRPVPAPTPVPVTEIPPSHINKKKVRRAAAAVTPAKQQKRDSTSNWSAWLGPVLALALACALILGTLGFSFINVAPGSRQTGDALQLIWNSLTIRPYQNNEVSYGTLLMFLVTWFFGGLLTLTELRRRNVIPARDIWMAAAVYYGLSIGVALVYWLIHASQLLSFNSMVSQAQVTSLQQLAQRSQQLIGFAEAISNVLTMFYLFVAIILFSLAGTLMLEVRDRLTKFAGEWGGLAVIPISLVVLIGITSTNLNPVRADIIYKQAEAIRNSGQLDLAIAHFKRARELNPTEDFYDLWLGAAFLDKANNNLQTPSILTNVNDIDSLLSLTFEQTYQLNQADTLTAAQIILEYARSLNPLNTDHSANLARLHRRWADLKASDPAARQKELETAGEYYRQATNLSPNNAQLWNEWALVVTALSDLARSAGDTAKADAYMTDVWAKLDHSLELDALYDQTYIIRGQVARAQGNTEEAQKDFAEASKLNSGNLDAYGNTIDLLLQQKNYTDAEKISLDFLAKNPDSLAALRTLARNIYYQQQRLPEAITTMEHVLQVGQNDSNHWEDQRVMAIMLAQVGRLQEALPMAQAALKAAPQDQQAGIQSLIDQLQTQLGVSTQLTQTLPFAQPTPTP